MVGTFLQ
jgi:hypothetical protein